MRIRVSALIEVTMTVSANVNGNGIHWECLCKSDVMWKPVVAEQVKFYLWVCVQKLDDCHTHLKVSQSTIYSGRPYACVLQARFFKCVSKVDLKVL